MKLRLAYLSAAILLATVMVAGCTSDNNPVAAANFVDNSPPPAPTGISVDFATELNRPVVSWQPSAAPDVAGYDVYQYSPDPSRENAYVKINSAPLTTAEFAVDGVGQDTEAYFRVRAVDQSGNWSAYSSAARVTLPASTPGTGNGPNPRGGLDN
jgi:hypothetical protein